MHLDNFKFVSSFECLGKRYIQGVGMKVTVKYTDTDIIKNEWGWWNVLYSNELGQAIW